MNSSAISQSGTSTANECGIYFPVATEETTVKTVYGALLLIIVLNIITSPITILLNLLVIIAVKTKPRLKTMSNIALGCLAVTDWLVGVIAQPSFIADTISTLRETIKEHCTLQLQLLVNTMRLLAGASLAHLALMNVERYIAIKHSFIYPTLVTAPRVLGSSAIAWATALLLNTRLAITDDKIYFLISSTVWFTLIAIIVFCQVVLFLETRRHEKQIAAQQVTVEARQKFLKEKKAFKLISTVLLILVLTYLPRVVIRVLIVNSVITSDVEFVAFFSTTFIVLLNSLINPITYCIRVRQFRVAFIEIILRKSNVQAENIENRVFGRSNAVAPLVVGQVMDQNA